MNFDLPNYAPHRSEHEHNHVPKNEFDVRIAAMKHGLCKHGVQVRKKTIFGTRHVKCEACEQERLAREQEGRDAWLRALSPRPPPSVPSLVVGHVVEAVLDGGPVAPSESGGPGTASVLGGAAAGNVSASGAGAARRDVHYNTMCRHILNGGSCPFGDNCNFAHSEAEISQVGALGWLSPNPEDCRASPAELRALASDVLALCDAAVSGTVALADLDKAFKKAYGVPLPLYGIRTKVLLRKLPDVALRTTTPEGGESKWTNANAYVSRASAAGVAAAASPPKASAPESRAPAPPPKAAALKKKAVSPKPSLNPEDCSASLAQLESLAGQVLKLCDAADSCSVSLTNLPEAFEKAYGAALPLYGVKPKVLLNMLPNVIVVGEHPRYFVFRAPAAPPKAAAAPPRDVRYKTMCRNILEGRSCTYGDKCHFAHSEAEICRKVDHASAPPQSNSPQSSTRSVDDVGDGHTDYVTSVAFADNARGLSASRDKTAKVWDLKKGQCIMTLEGHTDRVTAICAFGGKFGQAITASDDKSAKVWKLVTGECVVTLKGHAQGIKSVCVMRDGTHAFTGSRDKTAKVWDLKKGQCIMTLVGHAKDVLSVCVTRDATRALTASADRTAKVWNLASTKCDLTLAGHSGPVNGVCLTLGEDRALTASGDKTAKVWDMMNGFCALTLKGHTDIVCAVGVTSDDYALTASGDKTMRLWELDDGACIRTIEGHTMPILSVSVSKDGKFALTGSSDKTAKVWNLADYDCMRKLDGRAKGKAEVIESKFVGPLAGHHTQVNAVSVTPDGRYALTGSNDASARLWNLSNGKCTLKLAQKNYVSDVCVSPDGQRALTGSVDGTAKLWDLITGKLLCTLTGHSNIVRAVCFSLDGTRAITGSADETAKIWDLATSTCLLTLEGHTGYVNSVCVADSATVLTASRDHTVKIWRLDTGECVGTLEGHKHYIEAICVAPDGERALTASRDYTAKVWCLNTGKCVLTLEGHTEWVNDICVTPDGKCALTASGDNTAKVWNLVDGTCILTLKGHTNWVNGICVTPCGKRAITASQDNTARVWNLEEEMKTQLRLHADNGSPEASTFLGRWLSQS